MCVIQGAGMILLQHTTQAFTFCQEMNDGQKKKEGGGRLAGCRVASVSPTSKHSKHAVSFTNAVLFIDGLQRLCG